MSLGGSGHGGDLVISYGWKIVYEVSMGNGAHLSVLGIVCGMCGLDSLGWRM